MESEYSALVVLIILTLLCCIIMLRQDIKRRKEYTNSKSAAKEILKIPVMAYNKLYNKIKQNKFQCSDLVLCQMNVLLGFVSQINVKYEEIDINISSKVNIYDHMIDELYKVISVMNYLQNDESNFSERKLSFAERRLLRRYKRDINYVRNSGETTGHSDILIHTRNKCANFYYAYMDEYHNCKYSRKYHSFADIPLTDVLIEMLHEVTNKKHEFLKSDKVTRILDEYYKFFDTGISIQIVLMQNFWFTNRLYSEWSKYFSEGLETLSSIRKILDGKESTKDELRDYKFPILTVTDKDFMRKNGNFAFSANAYYFAVKSNIDKLSKISRTKKPVIAITECKGCLLIIRAVNAKELQICYVLNDDEVWNKEEVHSSQEVFDAVPELEVEELAHTFIKDYFSK